MKGRPPGGPTHLEVDGQVEEVVRALVSRVNFVQKHLLAVLVGYVPHLNRDRTGAGRKQDGG